MIRPRPARWFELLVARDDTPLALEALAATGAVELETRAGATLPADLAELPPLLQRFEGLAQRYRAWWPRDGLVASSVPEPPLASLQRGLEHLQRWAAEAEPPIRGLQKVETEAAEVQRWQRVIEHLDERRVDLGLATAASRPLQVRLAVTPADSPLPIVEAGRDGQERHAERPAAGPASGGTGKTSGLLAASIRPTGPVGPVGPVGPIEPIELNESIEPIEPIVLAFVADGWHHALAVGTPDRLHALAQLAAAAKGHWHAPPAWLQSKRSANLATAAARAAALRAEAAALRAQLAALTDTHELRRSLADARRLQWVLDNVPGLDAGEWFAWVTGWTSASPAALVAAIERCGARALLRMLPAPRSTAAPLLLANPRWARPFEVFARALGMPAGNEADPSVLLALVVPLMFGYMFGDVGQGVVVAAVGFALRRRFALARLFIAGGLAATAFGFVFGSVFSLHVLPPLWVEPLADPLAVLAAPLVGGAFLLIAGLALAALQAHWRGELAGWAAADAGYVLSYVGLVAAPLMAMVAPPAIPAALAAAALGAAWFCAGRVGRALIQARQDPAHRAQTAPAAASNAAATTATTATATTASATTAGITAALTAGFAAVGELVERLLQVLLNTLSFARVGAFALAHAGLSSALLALTQAAPHPLIAALVVVLGNAIVVLLEGLVVSIQTTRLVLFEFFARFLAGQGRVFRPLPPPPSTHELAPPDAAAMAGAARVAGVAAVAGAA